MIIILHEILEYENWGTYKNYSNSPTTKQFQAGTWRRNDVVCLLVLVLQRSNERKDAVERKTLQALLILGILIRLCSICFDLYVMVLKFFAVYLSV